MFKFLKFLVIFTSILFTIYSNAASSLAQPPLYKISKDGDTSHILGTIHIGVGLSEMPEQVMTPFNASEILVTEVKTSIMAIISQIFMDKIKFRKKGSAKVELDTLISEPAWQRLTTLLPKLKPKVLRTQTPAEAFLLVLGVTYAESAEKLKDDLGEIKMLDLELSTSSWGKRKLKGLESNKERLKLLNGKLKAHHLEEYLIATDVDNIEDLKKLISNYKMGDFENEDLQFDDDELENALVFDRNKLWAPRVDAIHKKSKEKDVFFAVGAAHLIGEGSLLEELERLGYRIERINTAPAAEETYISEAIGY